MNERSALVRKKVEEIEATHGARVLAICAADGTVSDAKPTDVVNAGTKLVLHVRAEGKYSGVPVEWRQAHVWTLRDGRLARLRVYDSRDEALEAIKQDDGEPSDEER